MLWIISYGFCTVPSQPQSSQHPALTAETSLGFASESNTVVEGAHEPLVHPLCSKVGASPSSPVPWLLEEPGTLWQCPPCCLRKPHTQNLTLAHMGSPCSESIHPSTAEVLPRHFILGCLYW